MDETIYTSTNNNFRMHLCQEGINNMDVATIPGFCDIIYNFDRLRVRGFCGQVTCFFRTF